eukprot:1604604-Prymnesium_polylepis.1
MRGVAAVGGSRTATPMRRTTYPVPPDHSCGAQRSAPTAGAGGRTRAAPPNLTREGVTVCLVRESSREVCCVSVLCHLA